MRTRILPFLTLAILAIAMFAGCAENSPPVAPAASQHHSGLGGAAPAPMFVRNPVPLSTPLVETTVTKRITARNGGDLAVGSVKVQIPARGLSADTTITLTLTDLEQLRFSIEPKGLRLSSAAQVTVNNLSKTTSRSVFRLSVVQDTDRGRLPLSTRRMGDQAVASMQRFGDFGLGGMSAFGDSIQFVRYLSGPGYTTTLVSAWRGGTVAYDRYTVRIPARALEQDTYITVRDPGAGYVLCELEPHGTQFRTPATLDMNLQGLDIQGFTDWTIFWFDDDFGDWSDQHAVFNGDKVTVSLPHFSSYAAGRAGW